MWDFLATLLLGLLKWVFGKKFKNKMNDTEFINYIENHLKLKNNAGKASDDFEDALNDKIREMQKKDL